MLSLTDLSKSYGPQTLFEQVSLQFNRQSRYGVVGANGSGKSTLLRLLAGDEQPTSGTVSIPKKARVGVLRQDHFRYEQTPIVEVVMQGHTLVWEAMRAKDALLENAADHFDADRYQELEDVIMRHDGYALESRAGEILEGLAIPTELHHEPLSILSGGFKLRVLLAQTLAADPDLLLLDEPTNHLDILSIRWLEKFLVGFAGCVLAVSHDHRFLNNICTHIVDVDYQRVMLYRGNYDAFQKAKVEERERKEGEIKRREQEIAHHRQFIERFRAKNTKARQAKSKAKQLERIVIDELPRSSRRYPKFVFDQVRPSGRTVVRVENVSKSFGDNRVLNDVSLTVQRGDRLAVIGPNGIGKSTLLKVMLGELAADGGKIEWGYETHVGSFSQDHHELRGSERDSAESWLWEHCSGEPVGFVRSKLAMVLFEKDEVDKRVGNLSGGEAARLLFSRLHVTRPNVLVLDEPNNHLDLEGIEALAAGLQDYEGTVIFVSHDRWFVSQLATRILEIAPQGMEDFPGSYEEYLGKCGDDHLDAEFVIQQTKREQGERRRRKRARS